MRQGRGQGRRWQLVLAVVLALCAATALALHFAGKRLKTQIEQTLGENSQVGAISLRVFKITISDVRIPAPAGWPATDALRAGRIEVVPDWRALLSRRIAIRSIHVEGAYLALWRTADGRLRLLPSLLEQQPKTERGSAPEVSIGEVLLKDAALDFYDGSIRRSPYLLRLEKVDARLADLRFPALQGRSPLSVSGNIKGVQRDGSYTLKGDIELATLNSELNTRMRGVDLVVLQPYLVKAASTGVRRGQLDLDLNSVVKQRHLHAQGKLVLHDLELHTQGSFMGLPRQAALDALRDKGRDIRLDFALDGSLDDPRFSLNESIAMRFGTGLAETLGVSIGDLGKSVGGAAAGVGGALRRLLGK